MVLKKPFCKMKRVRFLLKEFTLETIFLLKKVFYKLFSFYKKRPYGLKIKLKKAT